jgi:nucleoside-diphosphate-sugar epimerase
MKRKKIIAITGSKGRIGTVLKNKLEEEIKEIDLPDINILNLNELIEHTKNTKAIIHLAWDTFDGDNKNPKEKNNKNIKMTKNIFIAAKKNKIKKIIIASSVHVHDLRKNINKKIIRLDTKPDSKTTYGRNKIHIEKLSKKLSNKEKIQTVCLRFGGVFINDNPDKKNKIEKAIHLRKKDCIKIIRNEIRKNQKEYFKIIYAVSNNKYKIHTNKTKESN